jgi:hypothetical protein
MNLRIGEGAVVGCPVHQVDLARCLAAVFKTSLFHRWASHGFAEMGRAVAGDVNVSNPEGDLAQGDQTDLLWRGSVRFECCCGVGAGLDVESLHAS